MYYIGLGEIVASVATALGVSGTAWCGCARRRALLNAWFPYAGLVVSL